MDWYLKVLKNYAKFNGRARREEYWMFFLFNLLVTIVISFVEGFIGSAGFVGLIYALAVLIPSIAVGVRRLHDTGRSGWWMLIVLVPLLGAIILLIFTVQDSTPGENQYGENPKGIGNSEEAEVSA